MTASSASLAEILVRLEEACIALAKSSAGVKEAEAGVAAEASFHNAEQPFVCCRTCYKKISSISSPSDGEPNALQRFPIANGRIGWSFTGDRRSCWPCLTEPCLTASFDHRSDVVILPSRASRSTLPQPLASGSPHTHPFPS